MCGIGIKYYEFSFEISPNSRSLDGVYIAIDKNKGHKRVKY